MMMTSNSASIAGSGVMNSWPLLNLCATESVKMPNHLPPMYVIARSYKQCDPAGLWAVADPGEGPQGSGPSPYFQTKMFFGDSPPPTPLPPPPHLDSALVSDLAQAPWHENSLINGAPDQRKMKISQSRGYDGCVRSPPQVPEVHFFVDQRSNQSEFIVLFYSNSLIV